MHIPSARICAPLLAAFFLVAPTSPMPAAGPKPGPVAYVTVETEELTIEFAGDRAWTISTIIHKGAVITGRTGFYGTVFSPVGGRWIGTGHNEGGVEQVEKAVLLVDGQPCELKDKAVYRGQQAELRKHSMLGPLRLEAVTTITKDRVRQHHRYEATADVSIGVLYAFMHPFLPSTTAWLAQKTDGTSVEGTFDHQGGHRVKDDVKWTAIHDPVSQRATLVWYPTPLVGQGNKTFYWDKDRYHKLYNQLYANAPLTAGTKFEAEVVLQCVETDTAFWKSTVQTMAKALMAETAAPPPKATSGSR
jgi:hypothetical protein